MGKMFRKIFRPSDDTVNASLCELIHSDVIGQKQTQMIRNYRYIIMCSDDHLRYREVYCMTAKSVLTREDNGEEEKMMNCLSIQREGKLWTYI
jgi:hypothetical protein